MNNTKYFNIDSDVHLTKGYLFSCIFNTREATYQIIPNSILQILYLSKKHTLYEIAKQIDNDYVFDFFNELVKNKIGIISNSKIKHHESKKYPSVNCDFITNIICELNESNACYLSNIINLGTEAILFVIRSEADFIENVIKHFNKCITITSIQILINFRVFKKFKSEILKYDKLGMIICANSEKDSFEQLVNLNIVYLKTTIDEVLTNKSTSPSNFSISKRNYWESQKYNTYLYGKLYISDKGDVFNDPCSANKITEISNPNLQEKVISFFNTSKEIFASKEICDVCRDCEYRNICITAGKHINRSEKEWYREKECDYNPYIGKWNWETGYSDLESCGIESGGLGFRINRKQLNIKISELW